MVFGVVPGGLLLHVIGLRITLPRSLVTALRHFDLLVNQRFLVKSRFLAVPLIFPSRDKRELLVIALGLAVLGLVFQSQVPSARFVSLQRVMAHQLTELEEVAIETLQVHSASELEEVRHPARVFQGHVQ